MTPERKMPISLQAGAAARAITLGLLHIILLSRSASTNGLCGALPDMVWQTDAQPHGVSDVGFAADGQRLVSASVVAKLWSTNGDLLGTFSIANDDVVSVALSPDSLRLAAGGGSGNFRLWRISDGAVLGSISGNSFGYLDTAFSSDSNLLARAYNQIIRLANPTNNALFLQLEQTHSDLITGIAFSPDNRWLGSVGYDYRAVLYRISDGSVLRAFPGGADPTGQPAALAFTRDGRYFVFGNADGTSTFWDLQTNGVARAFPGWGSAARFSPDGQVLLTVTDGVLKFWRISDGKLLVSYDGVSNVRCIDISPDGKFFAYGGANLVLARMPLFITECTLSGGNAVLRWTGGSGLYQLQRRANFAAGSWENVGGPTTASAATNVISATVFYRVQSLPNP